MIQRVCTVNGSCIRMFRSGSYSNDDYIQGRQGESLGRERNDARERGRKREERGERGRGKDKKERKK